MDEAKRRLRMSNPWHLLATGFGSGLSPVMPGTGIAGGDPVLAAADPATVAALLAGGDVQHLHRRLYFATARQKT